MAPSTNALTSEFLEAMTKISRKLRTTFNARVTAHGLTYPRARALFRLAKRPGMTQTELACELELEQPTLVRLLDRMAELDLVTRVPAENDRRAKKVELTAHGKEQAALVQRLGEEIRDEIFEGLEDGDLRAAVALFDRIAAQLERMGEPVEHV
ncbi:MarR family winged helix-turn-helix transcriptional regulator [Amorphus sp. MBR-141]